MIRKIVKQGIIWFSNMQIRYFKHVCEPCLNAPERLIYWQFSWWHHFKRATLPFQLFSQVFLHSQSLCFSKIITRRLKFTMETLSLTFLGNILIDRQCWVSQDASNVSYSNGLKIPTQMVLQVDALPKHWRVNKFWRFGKLSCKIMTDNVLPHHHYYLVSYLSINLCSAVLCKSFVQIFITLTLTNFSVLLGRHIFFNLHTKLTEIT